MDSSATLSAEYFHRIANDETTEHISLGDDFGVLAGAVEPEKIVERIEIKNRTRGRRTELVVYEEGFLRVREYQRKKKARDYLLSLRFLAPTFATSQYMPMRVLHVAAACCGFSALCALIAWLSPWNAFFTPAAVLGATGAVLASMLFLFLAHEKRSFSTTAGDAAVLTLLGTVGSFKRCQQVAPKIVAAIESAHRHNTQQFSDYLRQEMREHYRLREFGVLTRQACGDATRRILARFG